MKPLAITLGDPAGIGAEIVFKALRDTNVPARIFGSRALANPPADIDFVDIGGDGEDESFVHGCGVNDWAATNLPRDGRMRRSARDSARPTPRAL